MAVIDIKESQIKYLSVVKQFFGKAAAFSDRTADAVADTAVVTFNAYRIPFACYS